MDEIETHGLTQMTEGACDCVLCESPNFKPPFLVREMMFGFGEEFRYHECDHCSTLQILDPPGSLDKYYPSNYYSYNEGETDGLLSATYKFVSHFGESPLKELSIRIVNSCTRADLSGALARFPKELLDLPFDSRILDVGCGSGISLRTLQMAGFRNLVGIDPYMTKPLDENGIQLMKSDIFHTEGSYDLILFNHSFEHIPNPNLVLRRVGDLLRGNGLCIIQAPIVPSYAWMTYRENWVQLDAPRHLFIPSLDGIGILSRRLGLKVVNARWDSTEFQFWGSEQNAHDIALRSSESFAFGLRKSMFTQSQIHKYRRMSAKLNDEGRGDQAVIVIRKG